MAGKLSYLSNPLVPEYYLSLAPGERRRFEGRVYLNIVHSILEGRAEAGWF